MMSLDLDDLERRIHVARNYQCTSASVPVCQLRALIAKVRAAEALADAVETKMTYSTGPVVAAAAAYRKAGQP